MGIRNDNLGGTDWAYEETNLASADLNDTFDEIARRVSIRKNNFEVLTLSVTSTSSSATFSSLTNINTLVIQNAGDKTCYFDLDGTATTSGFAIPRYKTITLSNCSFSTFSAICGGSDTTTLKILGFGGVQGSKYNYEIKTISSSSTSSSVTFTNTTSYKDVLIYNGGGSYAYIEFDGTATVSTGYQLKGGDYLQLNDIEIDTISSICNGSDTTTIYIIEVHN
jgi:hypothetical protein